MINAAADRYFKLIEATLREGLSRSLDSWMDADRETFPLEAALAPLAVRLNVCGPGSSSALLESVAQRLSTTARFVDGAGHSRPSYAALAARAVAYGNVPTSFGDRLLEFAAALSPSALLATNGKAIVEHVFAAWAIYTRDRSVPLILREAAIATLKSITRLQQPDGTFLARTDADSLEPQWYDELSLLHALSCYASESGDEEIEAAVGRAVKYHAAETQPDHASSHPWAIAAFLDEPDAIPLADMMLHAAGVQEPRTMDAVSLLLLADALDCGRRRATR